MSEMGEAYYHREGERFIPGPFCRGPWSDQTLNGRVVAGLAGGVADLRHGSPGFRPARMTVDMVRMSTMAPVEVVTEVVHESRRVRLIEIKLIIDDVITARGTLEFLAEGRNADTQVWGPPAWDAPPPQSVPAVSNARADMAGIWENRPIEGGFGEAVRRKQWNREIRPLIADEPLTAFQRCALAADFTSPFSNAGVGGLGYINTDVTLYLHRLPVGEFIGFEVLAHHAHDGIANGMVALHDIEGAIGSGAVAALAQARRPG